MKTLSYLLLFIPFVVACGSSVSADTINWRAFPKADLPFAGDASKWGQRPWLLLQPSLLNQLKDLWNSPSSPNLATTNFKNHVDGLLSETTCQDKSWLCGDGHAAAGLALAWQITKDAKYASKACDLFLQAFTGDYTNVGGNWISNEHYSLALDWMFDAPCMTSQVKASMRSRLVKFSDQAAIADSNQASISHDSDMNANQVSSHLLAGLAIRGMDTSGDPTDAVSDRLLSRAWTILVDGVSTDPNSPVQPLLDFYRQSVESGIPIVGLDYGVGDDMLIFHHTFAILDNYGIAGKYFPEIRPFWANAMRSYIHLFDPTMTLWHWYGDTQDPTDIANCVGCAFQSYVSMSAHWAAKFGDPEAAEIARFHYDEFEKKRSYVTESDPLLWFIRSWNSSGAKLDYRSGAGKQPRVRVAGVGQGQHTGMALFRSAWTSSGNPSDSQQVTWGAIYASGSYPWDHIQNDAGNFFFWRNGEWLITEPRSYSGPEVAEIYNSLSIMNPAASTSGYDYKSGGPIVYGPEGPAFLARGRSYGVKSTDDTFVYAAVNMDHKYNYKPDQWSDCTGVCRAPVKNYTRHFVWDGGDFAMLFDRVKLVHAASVALRFRTNGPGSAPVVLTNSNGAKIVKLPSSGNSYRTLIRELNVAGLAWNIVDESETWPKGAYQLDDKATGFIVRTPLLPAGSMNYDAVTVMHFGKSSGAGTTQLDSASLVEPLDGTKGTTGSHGACVGTTCAVFAGFNVFGAVHSLRSSASYKTAAGIGAGRHLVGDLDARYCYSVSVNGRQVASGLKVLEEDNTIVVDVGEAGATVSVAQVACAPQGSVTTAKRTSSTVVKKKTTVKVKKTTTKRKRTTTRRKKVTTKRVVRRTTSRRRR